MKQIELNDVALREGDQVEGGKMSTRDQLTYIDSLIKGGISRIEIGYPGSSPEQLKRCKSIVEHVKTFPQNKRPLLSGLATASKEMIDAVKEAGCDICHIYIPASEEFISTMFDAEKYGNTLEGKQEWVLVQATTMVKYAKSIGFEHVEYSPEDAARSDKDFVCRVVETVISAGATIVNIPDTTGLRVLDEFGNLIKYIKEKVPNISKAKISVHVHNDSDNATNNTLQAILAGADIVEGTFYGIGERSGMTKFESIIMNIKTRRDIFHDIEIKFDSALCYSIVHFIAQALGMPVPRHWVVVGSQNAICSSGTHQAIEAQAKDISKGYYSWDPVLYGHGKVETVINQSSGRKGILKNLQELGYNNIKKEDLDEIYARAMKITDHKKRAIKARDLTAILHDVLAVIPFHIEIVESYAAGGKGTKPIAIITAEANGRRVEKKGSGNGIFDAVMNAVEKAAIDLYETELKGIKINLDDWRPIPITSGSEAQADVYSRIRFTNGEGGVFAGRAVDSDTIQSSAQSFANCFSWYIDHLKNSETLKTN